MVLRGSEASVSDLVRAGVRGSQAVETDQLEMHSSAPALIAAIEANISQRARDVASGSPQIELHDGADVLWVSSEIADPYLHRVFRARFPPEEVDHRIEAVIAEYESRGLPLSWAVGSFTVPPGLGSHLEKAGLIRTADQTGMRLDHPCTGA
jgi:hypothetical protein